METKICTKCGRELPIDQFNWRDKSKGTRRADCKECHSNYMNLLFQIMEIDMNAGVPLWKDVIINYRFENRSQDFTYIALDNYLNKFGFENTLDLFKKIPNLRSYCFASLVKFQKSF